MHLRVEGVETALHPPGNFLALSTFSDLVQEARDRVSRDALAAGLPDAGRGLNDRGTAYGDAVGMYLAFAIDKVADRGSSLGRWDPTPTQSGIINTFSRQALPMTWNFAEANPLGDASGNHRGAVDLVSKALLVSFTKLPGFANQEDVANQVVSADKIVSTDPPYYDNVPYLTCWTFSMFGYVARSGPFSPTFSPQSLRPRPRN
jgi:putative DNA methylase